MALTFSFKCNQYDFGCKQFSRTYLHTSKYLRVFINVLSVFTYSLVFGQIYQARRNDDLACAPVSQCAFVLKKGDTRFLPRTCTWSRLDPAPRHAAVARRI